jgi:hypothetical protein
LACGEPGLRDSGWLGVAGSCAAVYGETGGRLALTDFMAKPYALVSAQRDLLGIVRHNVLVLMRHDKLAIDQMDGRLHGNPE